MAQNQSYQNLEKKLLATPDSEAQLKQFISMAENGHYPLFFKEWIAEAIKKPTPLTTKIAKKHASDILKKLERHHKLDRKQSALFQLKDDERNLFINSIFKLLENNIVDQNKELH